MKISAKQGGILLTAIGAIAAIFIVLNIPTNTNDNVTIGMLEHKEWTQETIVLSYLPEVPGRDRIEINLTVSRPLDFMALEAPHTTSVMAWYNPQKGDGTDFDSSSILKLYQKDSFIPIFSSPCYQITDTTITERADFKILKTIIQPPSSISERNNCNPSGNTIPNIVHYRIFTPETFSDSYAPNGYYIDIPFESYPFYKGALLKDTILFDKIIKTIHIEQFVP